MPYDVVSDPGLKRSFSVLGSALFADPTKLIRADLARHQRDKLIQETAKIQRQNESMTRAQQMLRDHPELASTPQGRANLVSTLLGAEGGLNYGARAAMGSTMFINPNTFRDQGELSRALIGTGQVSGWNQTPTGAQQVLDAAYDKTVDAAKLRGGGRGTVPTVSIRDSMKMQDELKKQLEARQSAAGAGIGSGVFGMFARTVPQSTQEALLNYATQEYQRTKNAQGAITAALDNVKLRDESDGLTSSKLVLADPSLAATLTQDPNAPAPAAPAAPALPAMLPQGTIQQAPAGVPSPFSVAPGAMPSAPVAPAPVAPAPVAPAAAAPAAPRYQEGAVYSHPDGRRLQYRGGKFYAVAPSAAPANVLPGVPSLDGSVMLD